VTAVQSESGVSLLELTIAMAIMMVVTAGLFGLLHPAHGAFAAEPEDADIQQRLRVAVDMLSKDLMMAGAGAYLGTDTGPLINYFAPVLPIRIGTTEDAIAIVYVPSTAVQTTLSADLPPESASLQVAADTNCPAGSDLCGVKAGMTLLVYDDIGNYDTFTVVSATDQAALVRITSRSAESARATYKGGSKVVEAQVHKYSRKTTTTSPPGDQLVHGDAPVVDHFVGLTFDLYGDPEPPSLTPFGPTYGPKPPPLTVKTTAYPAGENCTFQIDDRGEAQVPRLTALNDTATLTKLTPAQLADGPWCPDDTDANRWDADLLRIRKIGITVRVEAALASSRGPAGLLFTNGGSSRRADAWVPDQEIRWELSPRNLNPGR